MDDDGRLVFDALSAVMLLGTALLGAYIPRYLASKGGGQAGTATSLAFHLGNMVSGGVMLSAGFCHLLADAIRQHGFIGRFPIATFLAAVGYLTTLLADQLVQSLTASNSRASTPSASYQADWGGLPGPGGSPGLFFRGPGAAGGGGEGHEYARLVNKQPSPPPWARSAHGGSGWPPGSDEQQAGIELAQPAANGRCCNGLDQARPAGSRGSRGGGPAQAGPRRPGSVGSLAVTGLPLGQGDEAGPPGGTPAAGGGSGGDPAECLMASGSPRAYTAGSLHPRGRPLSSLGGGGALPHPADALVADGQLLQQQQQLGEQQPPGLGVLGGGGGTNSNGLQRPPHQQQSGGGHQQEQQQQQHHAPAGSSMDRTGSLTRSGRPLSLLSPEVMTEACTVARVAGHLELEMAAHSHAHFQVFLSQRPLSFATTVLLACALCIHSTLEGIALGAQRSMQATEDIMLAIAAHKGLAAYALGASIVESKASAGKFWTVVCLFACATPLGIGLGYATSGLGHGSVSAAMSALASGTFLYVALNEVIPKELEHPDGHRLVKVAALLLGFGAMSLLAVWA